MLLSALDSRAATYEKLEQLMPALRDGKAMIEMKPKMPKVDNLTFRFHLLKFHRDTFALARFYSCKERNNLLCKSMPEVWLK